MSKCMYICFRQWLFAPAHRMVWAQQETPTTSMRRWRRCTTTVRSWWVTLRSPWWSTPEISVSCRWVCERVGQIISNPFTESAPARKTANQSGHGCESNNVWNIPELSLEFINAVRQWLLRLKRGAVKRLQTINILPVAGSALNAFFISDQTNG